MSPLDAAIASQELASIPEPELILLSDIGKAVPFAVLIERIADKWGIASAILANQASGVPAEGKSVNVFVQLPRGGNVFDNRNWTVTLLPGNVDGFDLKAAYLERWGPCI